MSIWVDCYIVVNDEGEYLELFGDETMAEQYVSNFGGQFKSWRIRHTIVDIEDYDNEDHYLPKKSSYKQFP